MILEARDNQGFPVCERALEMAGMEDKWKLGKPVKIKVLLETKINTVNDEALKLPTEADVGKLESFGEESPKDISLNWVQ